MNANNPMALENSLPKIFLIVKEEAWFLQSKNSLVRFYSKRSLLRDTQIFLKQWQELDDHQTLLIVAPFIKDLWLELEKEITNNSLLKKKFFWLSFFFVTNEKNALPLPFLISSFSDWQSFLQSLEGSESFKIFQHSQLKKIEAAENFSFHEWLKSQWQKAALRLKTILHFKKIWQKNFHQNKKIWLKSLDISELTLPDALIFAGPSAQKFFLQKNNFHNIWVVDTVVSVCLQQGVIPNVVFSIDGGISSYEHFSFHKFSKLYKNVILVMDVLSLPAIVHKKFKQKVSYASSYPAAQIALSHAKKKKSIVENSSGNVGGFMLATFQTLFGKKQVKIFGNDGEHISFVTHVRGSAYHQKQYLQNHRLQTCEQYFFHLAKKYYPQENKI